MKKGVVFVVASILLACSNDEYESTISCNEEGCTGTYVGAEFDNSKPKGKKTLRTYSPTKYQPVSAMN